MPSPPYKLTPANPTQYISNYNGAGWIWIDNPTGSPILLAVGRTDIPTESSADVFIPMLSTVLAPAYGSRDFGMQFQNTLALGNPIPQTTATIIIGDRGEAPPSFGSIQQDRQQYYDRPNLKPIVSMLGGGTTLASSSASLYVTDYKVPPRRKAIVTLVTLTVYRSSIEPVTGNIGSAITQFQLIDPNNNISVTSYSAELYPGDPTKNYLGAFDKVIIPLQLPLLTGWSVHLQGSNSMNVSTTTHLGDVFIYEFDA